MTTRINPSGLAHLKSPQGPVARHLYALGLKVQARAKALAPVDTGRLRSSITVEVIEARGTLVCRIGTNVVYARAVHNGTGIYGSRGTPITPTNANVLRFKPRGASAYIFRPSVKGSPGRPFLRDALGVLR